MYPWQAPFVCGVEAIAPLRRRAVDVYAGNGGDGRRPVPAVVFVHGGPLPSGLPVLPRDWPVYRGYAALSARAGLAAVTFDHDLHCVDDYPAAYTQLRTAIDAARAEAAVDPSRVAIWAFSGGAPLTAPLLQDRPDWLRCIALTYPILDSTTDLRLPDGYRLVDALHSDTMPIVLTRVGREAAPVSAGVNAFLARAEQVLATLEVIDVPDAQHGFDALPAVPGAREAVETAIAAVRTALTS